MAKSKKKTKLSAFSRFSKKQLIIAGIFILGFGGFGIWKVAFSSAASFQTIKSISGNWWIPKGQPQMFDSLTINPGGTGSNPLGAGTYRLCAVVISAGSTSSSSNTAHFFTGPSGVHSEFYVSPMSYTTKCSKSYTSQQNSGSLFTPSITVYSDSKNALRVKQVYWQKYK